MSDILSEEKSSVSTSYDSIRKMIVLLDFYRFWLNVKLSVGYTELTKSELTETYIDEANARPAPPRHQTCGRTMKIFRFFSKNAQVTFGVSAVAVYTN